MVSRPTPSRRFRALAGALVCLLGSPATAGPLGNRIGLGPQGPFASITDFSGLGTAHARVRVEIGDDDVVYGCEDASARWDPAKTDEYMRECIANGMQSEVGRHWDFEADCPAGKILADGKTFTFDGIWSEPGSFGEGMARFRDADGTVLAYVRASEGYVLPSHFEMLCPGWAVNLHQRAVAAKDAPPAGSARTRDHCDMYGFQQLWLHNGSLMNIDPVSGCIVYSDPKPSLRRVVRDATVLFHGTIVAGGRIDGTAYTFKKGCEPAPYHVTGHWPQGAGEIVLRGDAPVRKGCKVFGYSAESQNARLVFQAPVSD